MAFSAAVRLFLKVWEVEIPPIFYLTVFLIVLSMNHCHVGLFAGCRERTGGKFAVRSVY